LRSICYDAQGTANGRRLSVRGYVNLVKIGRGIRKNAHDGFAIDRDLKGIPSGSVFNQLVKIGLKVFE
jgi:hypothetical protein